MQKGDWIGLAMVAAMIAAFGGLLWLAPDAPETDFGPVDVGGGSVTMAVKDADEVTISADLAKSGWVTVHASMGPAPANVIGASRLLPEGHSGVTIALTEEMQAGLTYIALLHVDNGDGVFVELEDFPIMTNGAVVRSEVTYDPLGIKSENGTAEEL